MKKGNNRTYTPPDIISYEYIARAMASKAEVLTFSRNAQYNVGEFIHGKIGDFNYQKAGRFEDWSYAAAWVYGEKNGTLKSCDPLTYPLDEDGIQFYGSGRQQTVQALSFLVETDNKKKPPQWTLGGRVEEVIHRRYNHTNGSCYNISGIFSQEKINFTNFTKLNLNGHINRNIRMLVNFAMAV